MHRFFINLQTLTKRKLRFLCQNILIILTLAAPGQEQEGKTLDKNLFLQMGLKMPLKL